jgi:hypothetical protein
MPGERRGLANVPPMSATVDMIRQVPEVGQIPH